MINKESLNQELWSSIHLHYEKECYEDVLKDMIFYLVELLQNKSECYDKDGESLITYLFSEKTPRLLINKNQTQSEIDEQRGYGFILRGLICFIRNPLSHKKKIGYTKDQVDSILLFVNNIIVPKLEDTKEFGYVDDWFKFIFIDNSSFGDKYYDKLLDNISKKDKADLMLKIIDNLSSIEPGCYQYVINKLLNSLTIKSQNDAFVLLNRKLIKAGAGSYLRMFFDHFDPSLWEKIDSLVSVRIEEMVMDSIRTGEMFTNPINLKLEPVDKAKLSIWASKWIKYFSNYDDIKKVLLLKLNNKYEAMFVIRYFFDTVSEKKFLLQNKDFITDGLKKKNYYIKEIVLPYMNLDDKDMSLFKNDFEIVKGIQEPK